MKDDEHSRISFCTGDLFRFVSGLRKSEKRTCYQALSVHLLYRSFVYMEIKCIQLLLLRLKSFLSATLVGNGGRRLLGILSRQVQVWLGCPCGRTTWGQCGLRVPVQGQPGFRDFFLGFGFLDICLFS